MNSEKAVERLKNIHDEHRFLLEINPYRLFLVQESLNASVSALTLRHEKLEEKLINDKIITDPKKTRYGGYFMIQKGNLIFWGPATSVEPATKEQFTKALTTGDVAIVNAAGELIAK